MGLFDDLAKAAGSAMGSSGQGAAEDPLGGLLGGLLGGGPGQHPAGPALGGLLGGSQAKSSLLMSLVLGLIQQNGGLGGLLGLFSQGGLGQHADSWISTGANLPVTGEQVQQVFGHGPLGQIASQLGLSHQDAGSAVAQVLPELVNRLTPSGSIPGNSNDLIARALGMLQGQ